jgi:hypothetical protein
MTLLGKIFTVLIFIMSVAFCILAVATFATHKNWRVEATKLQTSLRDAQTQFKNKQTELDSVRRQLEIEEAARRSVLSTLQAKLTLMLNDVTANAAALQEKNAALTEQTQAAKTAEETLKNITAEVQKLRTDIRLAQQDRDEQYVKALALVDKLNQAEAMRQRLEEQNTQLQDQYARLNAVAQRLGFDARTLVSQIPPPLDGKVLGVDENKGLVEVSLGSDEGLKKGHMLQVFRGNQYLGQIILKEVQADRAVGEVDKKMQRGRIKKDDNVTTKLS